MTASPATPTRKWRLGQPTRPYILGPVTAVQGIMAFGWVVLTYALTMLFGWDTAMWPAISAGVVCGLVMFGKVAGRPVDSWISPMVGWTWKLARRHRTRITGPGEKRRPPPAAAGWSTPIGVTFTSRTEPDASAENLGVFCNTSEKTWTVVCRVAGDGFHLYDRPAKERFLNQWGAATTALGAAHNSPIRGVQWIHRITRAGAAADEAWGYFSERATPGAATDDYRELLDTLEGAMVHEAYVVLAISAESAASAIKHFKQDPKGSDTSGAVFVLREQAKRLTDLLDGATVEPLTQPELNDLIATQLDPFAPAAADGSPWPAAHKETWSSFLSGGTVHITSALTFPDEVNHPDFLGNLLLSDQLKGPRTVSAVMAFMDPAKAARKIEHRQSFRDGSREIMARWGRRETARETRRDEALNQTEEDLSVNHGHSRFDMFVTVSAPTEEAARSKLRAAETAAQTARCEIQPLYGEQGLGFVIAALPTAKARN